MSDERHSLERLCAFLDGELSPAERAEVEAHLRECATCRQELDGLLAVDAAARELTVAAPPGYFEAFPGRVRQRLAARRRRAVPAWTLAAAAAVLLAVLTPLTLRERSAPAPTSARESLRSQPTPAAQAPAAPPAATAAASPGALADADAHLPRRGPLPAPAQRSAVSPPPPPPAGATAGRLAERDAASVPTPEGKAEAEARQRAFLKAAPAEPQ
ncbi:MAG TPA: zf-HC2 domain-containing protein, partial [Vicinamibacteria bacterium]|nr:zf-HC2 domain-containing protein [Vicinamibacteria bacterium]